MNIEDEIFLVVQNRRDGSLPNPVKAVGNGGAEIFFTEDDANEFLEKVVKANGPFYGVYRALLRIEERLDNKPDKPECR